MYKKQLHIHFMGIGGIGMSGIAYVLRCQGYRVSGCDIDIHQKSIATLQHVGCEVADHHYSSLCLDPSIDILVYSSAISLNHPEVVHAQKRGALVIPRARMLAEIMRTKYSIAVAGSHGKTTTSSMIAHILLHAQYDPTIIIGGHIKHPVSHEHNTTYQAPHATNARYGHGDFLVAEADESDRSFLYFNPTFALVTNIDLEHLDTYKNIDDVVATYKQFLHNIPFYGIAFMCTEDPIIQSILPLDHIKTVTYGLNKQASIRAEQVAIKPSTSTYTVFHKNQELGEITLHVPGTHNVLNSLGAIAVTQELGIPFCTIASALASFAGVERRFSYCGTYKGAELFDDYAHHPTEIEQCLNVARRMTRGKLHVIFQPHRFSRTYHLWDNFIQTFSNASIDTLAITDIYPASEAPIEHVTSQQLVNALNHHKKTVYATYIPLNENFASIIQHIDHTVQPDDLVLLLGAGQIYKIQFLLNKPLFSQKV
jgi:UDP-N-acetylmuramate--alanine ligase